MEADQIARSHLYKYISAWMTQSGLSILILTSSVRIMAIPSVSLVLCHSATSAGIEGLPHCWTSPEEQSTCRKGQEKGNHWAFTPYLTPSAPAPWGSLSIWAGREGNLPPSPSPVLFAKGVTVVEIFCKLANLLHHNYNFKRYFMRCSKMSYLGPWGSKWFFINNDRVDAGEFIYRNC